MMSGCGTRRASAADAHLRRTARSCSSSPPAWSSDLQPGGDYNDAAHRGSVPIAGSCDHENAREPGDAARDGVAWAPSPSAASGTSVPDDDPSAGWGGGRRALVAQAEVADVGGAPGARRSTSPGCAASRALEIRACRRGSGRPPAGYAAGCYIWRPWRAAARRRRRPIRLAPLRDAPRPIPARPSAMGCARRRAARQRAARSAGECLGGRCARTSPCARGALWRGGEHGDEQAGAPERELGECATGKIHSVRQASGGVPGPARGAEGGRRRGDSAFGRLRCKMSADRVDSARQPVLLQH